MAIRASSTPLTFSRRSAMGMALATALAGKFVAFPGLAVAQDAATGTWNWGGNAGHTGDLPGPGLKFDGALGELWRLPRNEFWNDEYFSPWDTGALGYLNGVIYTFNGDSLWARRLEDGSFLWAKSPKTIVGTPEASPTPLADATPDDQEQELAFDSDGLAIVGSSVLVNLESGGLWSLDAQTGALNWTFEDAGVPTVVGQVAYCGTEVGVIALEIGEEPVIRWEREIAGGSAVLWAGNEYLYVLAALGGYKTEIRSLSVNDGSEYWRTDPADIGGYLELIGTIGGQYFGNFYFDEMEASFITMIETDGSKLWDRIAEDLVRRPYYLDQVCTSVRENADGAYSVVGMFPENGQNFWELELYPYYEQWNDRNDPVICDGIVYISLSEDDSDVPYYTVVADPGNAKLLGRMETALIPLFIADGIMLAYDDDIDEVVAIGSVTPALQANGRAKVTKDATLRGAPSDSAIEREKVADGTEVTVTGESESDWWPVSIPETGSSGWLPADALEGLEGGIKFSPIDISTFGTFTVYSRFTAGTRAEVTEKVDLRGAPSETSAKKSTLEPGTIVVVSAEPTSANDVEWCPVTVEESGEAGWLPTSVLKLAAN